MDQNPLVPPLPPLPPQAPPSPGEGPAEDRYIRTFGGDVHSVEAGATPNLAPLRKTAPLRTYSGDFSDRVRESGAVTATIVAAEQDSGPRTTIQEEVSEPLNKNFFYGIVATVLLLLGAGGVYFAYTNYFVTVPVIPSPVAAAPIFVDEGEQVSGTGTALIQAIEQSSTRPLTPHGVRYIYTGTSATAGNDIFSNLPISVPDIIRRNILAPGSMAGIVNSGISSGPGTGGTQSPFFILSVAAYRDTFAGMLAWEKTMPGNLSVLFPGYALFAATPDTAIATTSAATSSSQTLVKTPPRSASVATSTPGFRDEVVGNHDVRAYRDAAGRSVLLYGYWNQTTLVIARDPAAFLELIGRLATAHTQP